LEESHIDCHQTEEKKDHDSEDVAMYEPYRIILRTKSITFLVDSLANDLGVHCEDEGHQADVKCHTNCEHLSCSKNPLVKLVLDISSLPVYVVEIDKDDDYRQE